MNTQTLNDHDAIVRLGATTERAVSDIKDIHLSVKGVAETLNAFILSFKDKIDAAVASKIDAKEVYQMKTDAEKAHNDLNRRVSFLERYAWIAIGGLYVLYILLQLGILHLGNVVL